MACDIKILSASGTNLPQQTKANTVTIGGTAQDCTQVNVTMSCGGDSASKVANVGFNGSWAVVFDTSALGCTCGQNFSVNAYCVGNPTCFTETTFDLACTGCPFVNDIAFIVHLEPPTPICVNGTTRALVSLTAAGSLGPGTYAWDFDDGSTATTTVQYVDHEFEFPDVSYNVKLSFTPAQAGCPPTSAVKTLLVPDCGAGAPRSGEEIPVPHPPARHRAPEGSGDVILHQQVREAAGTVFPGEGDHRRNGGKAQRRNGRDQEKSVPGGCRRPSTTLRLCVFAPYRQRKVPQAPRSCTGHRLALLPARS